jgi:hypothetical protein
MAWDLLKPPQDIGFNPADRDPRHAARVSRETGRLLVRANAMFPQSRRFVKKKHSQAKYFSLERAWAGRGHGEAGPNLPLAGRRVQTCWAKIFWWSSR